MIIGASLGGFSGLTLRQAIELYSRLSDEFNLKAIEIRFEREGKRPALWFWEADEEIRNFLSGFEVAGVHLPFVYLNPISQNPYIKKISISQLKSAIEKASDLGVSYCVMHAKGFNYALTPEKEFDEWRRIIEELVICAEDNSILLTLENANFLHDLNLLAKMVRGLNSKWLKITFDIGHAHIRKVASLSTYPIKDLMFRAMDFFFRSLLPKKTCHTKLTAR